MRRLPSFLSTKIAGDPHGEELGWIYLSGAFHQAVSLAPLILMRASGNTSCIMVRFRGYCKLKLAVGWCVWQFFGKYIWKLTDHRNKFQFSHNGESHFFLGYASASIEFCSLPFLAGQSDFSGRAVYADLILGQPIHTQDNIQLYRLNDYKEVGKQTPLILISRFRQTRLLLINDPGVCTSIFLPKSEQGNLFWAT